MRVTNVFFSHFKSTIRDLQVTVPQDSVCPFATMPLCHIKFIFSILFAFHPRHIA